MRSYSSFAVVAGVVSCIAAGMAEAQPYPSKPIRIITGSVGSNVDVSSRLIAQNLSGPLGQQIVIDNRAGALIGGDLVSKAAPDGYTLLVTGGSFWVGPLMRDNTPYDAVNDFTPVTLLVRAPAVLVVHPSLPAKSVRELVALAKAHPGELNYSSGGTGGAVHLAAELFKALTGTNMVGIFYKSDSQQIADLLGGRTQLTFGNPAGVSPLIAAGKLRPLAVTSSQPSALFPALPTIAASVPGYESVAVTAMFAPAKTPAAITQRLNQEVVKVLHNTEVKDRFLKNGLETVGNTPEQFSAAMRAEIARMGKVIKDAGIRGE